jgi:hypothetical protein
VDRFLRRATLLLLIGLAFAVWFEASLFGGERGVIRLTVGVLCIYVALHSLERQRLEQAFRGVLAAFRSFRGGEAVPPPAADERDQAVRILVEALRRGGPAAPVALENLRRLTGEDFGAEAAAWEEWLRHRGKA